MPLAMFWGEARNQILANEDIHKCKIYPHVPNLKAKGFKALPISTTIHHIKPKTEKQSLKCISYCFQANTIPTAKIEC